MEDKLFNEMYKVELQHWWFVARRKIIENVIKTLELRDNSVILDAGCGNGDNLSVLSKYGNVVAMERDSTALENARSRKIGKIYQGELPDKVHLDIRKDNDLIVLLDVLEHIDDDAESLFTLSQYVNERGKILITVPAYQFFWTNHDEQHHHKRRYTANKLKKLIEMNGWKVDYISYFNTLLFPLALVDRFKQKMFPPKDVELKLPPKWLNSFFLKIFSFESNLIGKIIFPFGLSIIMTATRK